MKISKKSVISGMTRTRDIPVNPSDYVEWQQDLGSIDDLMPYLTETDREFILSGIVAGEWNKAFGEMLAA